MSNKSNAQKWLAIVTNKNMRRVGVLFLLVLLAIVAIVIAERKGSLRTVSASETRKLRLVHVVFRHGVRTPADTYPNDIYINQTFYPYGWGQITNKGRLNQYNSGVFLRKRYDEFLGKIASTSVVYAQSTEPDRAYMSCALTLAGLWPTEGTDLDWNPKLNWSPIPIKSQPLNEDTLLLARKNCPRYYEELDDVFKSEEVQQILTDNSELFDVLTTKTGMTIKTPDDVQSLYNTLRAEKEYGLKLPKWAEEFYPDRLIPLTEQSFVLNAYNNELKKLKGGPLLKKLISDWTSVTKGKLSPKDRKIFVYAGHDSTVSNLMLALGGWDAQIPQYGIMVLLELYENTKTNEFSVEIFLRNSTLVDPFPITIHGCEQECPLQKLIELTKDVVPENWENDCKSRDPNYVPPPPAGP